GLASGNIRRRHYLLTIAFLFAKCLIGEGKE
ncbi:MAG: hypothetical protein JWO81_277, partial [Alphaproteobacteria bacterium]|nr:hypothetical protein [Alphaproteobacteria bacterium]